MDQCPYKNYFYLHALLASALLCVVPLTAAAQGHTPATEPLTPSHNANASASANELSWQNLSAAQHQALQPLASAWPHLSEIQQKKWITLGANFATLSAPAKARLHARMTEWAALTPTQRTQARLNYSQIQSVPPEDKAERWEVYQAMTPEQKQALAASAPKVPLAPHVKPPKTPVK